MEDELIDETILLKNGLTEYEIHRKPLQLIQDDRTIQLDIRSIRDFFSCPVCLSIIRDCHTVECLHRFCYECLSSSIRRVNKECPFCRIKLSTKRKLRPDPDFNSIILSLVGDIDKYEEDEESIIENINNQFDRESLRTKVSDGLKRQKEASKIKTPKNIPPYISCIFKPRMGAKSNLDLELPFVAVPKQATVQNLISYLKLKFNHMGYIDLFASEQASDAPPIPYSVSINELYSQYWSPSSRVLPLFYEVASIEESSRDNTDNISQVDSFVEDVDLPFQYKKRELLKRKRNQIEIEVENVNNADNNMIEENEDDNLPLKKVKRKKQNNNIIGGEGNKKTSEKKEQTKVNLPPSFTRKLFSTHIPKNLHLSPQATSLISKYSDQYFDRLASDVSAYAHHANRRTIEKHDLICLFKRQKLINEETSINDLVRKNLANDLIEQLIPIARANNVVFPKRNLENN